MQYGETLAIAVTGVNYLARICAFSQKSGIIGVFVAKAAKGNTMQFTIETEQETDGRWIAEVPEISGAMQYGDTREQAIARAEALALRVAAERIEVGEQPAEPLQITFAPAA